MLVSKLIDGVLVIEQGALCRAFRPKLAHRIMLVWIFRYFASLPAAVLTRWQKSLVTAVISNGVLTPLPNRNSNMIIGTGENATTGAVDGKPLAPSTDWEFARAGAARNRVSA